MFQNFFLLCLTLVLLGRLIEVSSDVAYYNGELEEALNKLLRLVEASFDDKETNIKAESRPKLILINFYGLKLNYLENFTLPNINRYFVQEGVKVNRESNITSALTCRSYLESNGTKNNETNISILKELANKRSSAIIGHFPDANLSILNAKVKQIKRDWFKKVDFLVDLFIAESNKRIDFGVLNFHELAGNIQKYGPYSAPVRRVLRKCDLIVGHLMKKLNIAGLESDVNVVFTSGSMSIKPDVEQNDAKNLAITHGTLLARGPNFKVKFQTNSSVDLADIYELMCRILDPMANVTNNASVDNVKEMLDRSDSKIVERTNLNQTKLIGIQVNKTNTTRENSSTVQVIVNVAGERNEHKTSRWLEFWEVLGFYHHRFQFGHLLPLLILILIVAAFLCICHMELTSKQREVAFMYTPLDNNYIETQKILK